MDNTTNAKQSTGWTDDQVRHFAKRFASFHKTSWHAYVADVREAFIDSFLFAIVLGQDRHDVAVADMRSLRTRMTHLLGSKHNMPNPGDSL